MYVVAWPCEHAESDLGERIPISYVQFNNQEESSGLYDGC